MLRVRQWEKLEEIYPIAFLNYSSQYRSISLMPIHRKLP